MDPLTIKLWHNIVTSTEVSHFTAIESDGPRRYGLYSSCRRIRWAYILKPYLASAASSSRPWTMPSRGFELPCCFHSVLFPFFLLYHLLQILSHTLENKNASELHQVQKSFSSVFPVEVDATVLPAVHCPMVKPVIGSSKCEAVDLACSSKHTAFQTSSALDLSYITEDAKITLSSVNG